MHGGTSSSCFSNSKTDISSKEKLISCSEVVVFCLFPYIICKVFKDLYL